MLPEDWTSLRATADRSRHRFVLNSGCSAIDDAHSSMKRATVELTVAWIGCCHMRLACGLARKLAKCVLHSDRSITSRRS